MKSLTHGVKNRLRGGPAPHGAGGLKSRWRLWAARRLSSRPSRGGWVEIENLCGVNLKGFKVPPLTGRVG